MNWKIWLTLLLFAVGGFTMYSFYQRVSDARVNNPSLNPLVDNTRR